MKVLFLRILPVFLAIPTQAFQCEGDKPRKQNPMEICPPLVVPGPRGGFLTAADMEKPAAVGAITASYLDDEINDQLGFYHNDPQRRALDCYARVVRSAPAVAVYGLLTVEVGIDDFRICDAQNPGYVLEEAQHFSELSCPDADLSAFSGRSIDEFALAEACTEADFTLLRNTKIKIKKVATAADQSVFDLTIVSGRVQDDATACAASVGSDKVVTWKPCTEFTKVVVDHAVAAAGATLPSTSFFSLDLNGASAGPGDTYYKDSNLPFVLNDWEGEMNYTEGQTAPTWTARRGDEVKNGVFTIEEADDEADDDGGKVD